MSFIRHSRFRLFNFTLLFIFFQCLLISNIHAQNYDAEVIQYTSWRELENNKLVQTDSFTIQINNRPGDLYTQVTIPYSKTVKLTDISGSIKTLDGKIIRELKASDITDKSAISDISLYEDNFNKIFQLKHNNYPYIICYTYKTNYREFLDIADWSPALYNDIPTRNANLNVWLPKGFGYKMFSRGISEFKIDSSTNYAKLVWKGNYLKPLKSELYSQPASSVPFVSITPLYFKYGISGCLQDWQSYGNWQFRLLENLDKLPDYEMKKISEMIKGVTDKTEIVKILYHYLQDNTRYINVSIGVGGLKPYPASYVAENKYGDCKALTNYMKAMLSYAGIESYYVKVYASSQPLDLIRSQPGQQFNHVVLAIPMDGDTLWLENTSNTQPFGYMGTFTQNRDALLISENDSRLVQVPSMKKEDNLITSRLEFELNAKGLAIVSLKNFYRGSYFEQFNYIHGDFNTEEKDRIIREYMPFENYEVINWELIKLHRDTAAIELNASLLLYNYLKPLEKEYYMSLYPCKIPAFTDPQNRTLPVALPFPICSSDTLLYNFPDGYELKTPIDPVSLSSSFGTYKLESGVYKGNIILIRWFELFAGNYSLSEYPDFYKFIQSVKQADNKRIIIKPII